MFLLVPSVSIQSFISLGKTFSEYLAHEILHRPDSWQGFLYIYLLSFLRFQTFCIKRFPFLLLLSHMSENREQTIHESLTNTESSTAILIGILLYTINFQLKFSLTVLCKAQFNPQTFHTPNSRPIQANPNDTSLMVDSDVKINQWD